VEFPTLRKQNTGEKHSSMDLKPVSAILASEELNHLNHLTRHLFSHDKRQFLTFLHPKTKAEGYWYLPTVYHSQTSIVQMYSYVVLRVTIANSRKHEIHTQLYQSYAKESL